MMRDDLSERVSADVRWMRTTQARYDGGDMLR